MQDMQGVLAQPPFHFFPGRPEPPSLHWGEVGSEPPPSREAPAGRYPFLSGRENPLTVGIFL